MNVILNPPYFNKKVIPLKDHGGGIGFLNKGRINKKGNISPITDMVNAFSILKEDDCDVAFYDDRLDPSSNIKVFCKKLSKKFNCPERVFMRVSLPTFNNDSEIAIWLKRIWPNTCIVAFGPAVRIMMNFGKNVKGFDVLVASDIEAVISKFVKNCDLTTLPGVYVLDEQRYVTKNEQIMLADLNKLPSPKYDCLDKKFSIYLVSSMGCPLKCNFCPYTLSQGHKFRTRQPELVIQDIQYIVERCKKKDIVFRDPIFSYYKTRVEKICNLMIEKKISINWECETHINFLDTDLVILMRKAGNVLINFGVESASKEVFEKSKKLEVDRENLVKTVKICKEIGINTVAFYILGFPGDTKKGIFKTIKLALDIDTDKAQFMLPNPYPGTELFEECIKQNKYSQKFINDIDVFFKQISNHTVPQVSFVNDITPSMLMLIKKYAILVYNKKYRKNILSKLRYYISFLVFYIRIKYIVKWDIIKDNE